MKKRFGATNYFQLLPYLKTQRKTIAQAFACTLAFTIFWPILASLAGRMASYIGAGDITAIAQLAGLAAIIFLVRGAVQYGQDALMAKAALAIAFDLRLKTYAHLSQLSLSYFSQTQTGDLSYRLTEDIDRIGEVINKVFHQFIPSILQLVVVLGYMFYINWQLTVATLVVAPLMAGLIGYFGNQLLNFARRSQNRISNLSALLTESFNGISVIQGFNAQQYQLSRFAQEAERNRRTKYITEQLKAFQFVVVGFLEAVSVIFLFFLGGWQIAQNNLTASDFVSYVAAVALLIDPISITTNNYNEFKQGEASVDRIFELLAVPASVVEKPHAMELPTLSGKVEYNHVYFAYPHSNGNQAWVLEDLNLLALPGEIIALVGMSGAGKSTAMSLLSRFYDPTEGQILVDGIDIRDVTLGSLRRQIGIVPQDTILFSGTIADNIAFSQPERSLEEVKEAAKVANAHNFICQLPNGYYTWVGERGANLSGGQRQRIAIARAVLLDPRILILDEATSSLDSESEALVQQALERLIAGGEDSHHQPRTVFIIAHRLATVLRSDRILVLEKGKIVESGNHEELLRLQGRYARFCAQQFQTGG
jgi:ATP-binding cassette subfamily B protein